MQEKPPHPLGCCWRINWGRAPAAKPEQDLFRKAKEPQALKINDFSPLPAQSSLLRTLADRSRMVIRQQNPLGWGWGWSAMRAAEGALPGDLAHRATRARGIIIAGVAPPRWAKEYVLAIAHLAEVLKFPVLAEGLSPFKMGKQFENKSLRFYLYAI